MEASWERFRRGDALTDRELTQMVKAATAAEAFLRDYKQSPALLFRLRLDIVTLTGYLQSRESESSKGVV